MTEIPIKLLLVDDEEDSRRASAKWMQRKGHDVTDVSNAAEAMSLLEREPFDVGEHDRDFAAYAPNARRRG